MPRILMMLTMKTKVLWVVTLCSVDKTLHIGGTYRLQLPPASADFLLVLFFNPEDVGNLLIRNVVLRTIRCYSPEDHTVQKVWYIHYFNKTIFLPLCFKRERGSVVD